MKYLLRKLFRMKSKRRYRPKPGWNSINSLEEQVYDLRGQIRSLARSLDRVSVSGVYMDAKDAKKYKNQDQICH